MSALATVKRIQGLYQVLYAEQDANRTRWLPGYSDADQGKRRAYHARVDELRQQISEARAVLENILRGWPA